MGNPDWWWAWLYYSMTGAGWEEQDLSKFAIAAFFLAILPMLGPMISYSRLSNDMAGQAAVETHFSQIMKPDENYGFADGMARELSGRDLPLAACRAFRITIQGPIGAAAFVSLPRNFALRVRQKRLPVPNAPAVFPEGRRSTPSIRLFGSACLRALPVKSGSKLIRGWLGTG